jgi:hypothetical protein
MVRIPTHPLLTFGACAPLTDDPKFGSWVIAGVCRIGGIIGHGQIFASRFASP